MHVPQCGCSCIPFAVVAAMLVSADKLLDETTVMRRIALLLAGVLSSHHICVGVTARLMQCCSYCCQCAWMPANKHDMLRPSTAHAPHAESTTHSLYIKQVDVMPEHKHVRYVQMEMIMMSNFPQALLCRRVLLTAETMTYATAACTRLCG